ncbi:hypothetical protein JXA80_02450 [bacterium]|nr:hypothetical protein [candidate division CSSED10-310 bacterium]
MRNSLKVMAVTGLFMYVFGWLFSGLVGAQIGVAEQMVLPLTFELRPLFAQFLSSELCLKGGSRDVVVIDLATGVSRQEILKNESVSIMMADPHRAGDILFATTGGKVYLARLEDETVTLTEMSVPSPWNLTVVHSILFDPMVPGRVLMADYESMAICSRTDASLQIQQSLPLPDPGGLICMVFPDHVDAGWFIVSAAEGKRFRGQWNSGHIENISGRIIEYGYTVVDHGIRFLPRGDFDTYFYLDYIPARPVFIKQHPVNKRMYYAATIGISPLRITIDSNNYYTLDYLAQNRMLTFSVDIDPANDQHIMFSTAASIQVSSDGGTTWKTIE